MMVKELEQKYNAMEQELYEVEQILGEALSYPRYCDDPKSFPDATEADGICVGEMTPAALAEQMAKEYALLSEHGIRFFMKGTEASSLVTSLNQEKKDFNDLARLFEKQNELLKTTQELLQLREKAVAKHEAQVRIIEEVIRAVTGKLNTAKETAKVKDSYIERLEHHLDQLVDLASRFNRMVYEVPDEKMPKAEWGDVPPEFVWWVVDADGEVKYWAIKPEIDKAAGMWWHDDIHNGNAEFSELTWGSGEKYIEIPFGIDWRTLISRRP